MEHNFTITSSAALKIKNLIRTENNEGYRLRIDVLGGGCSGFQYNIFLDNKLDEQTDIIFFQEEAEVCINSDYMELLNNSILDYVEDLGSAKFEIINPNATAKCGCGNSFGV